MITFIEVTLGEEIVQEYKIIEIKLLEVDIEITMIEDSLLAETKCKYI